MFINSTFVWVKWHFFFEYYSWIFIYFTVLDSLPGFNMGEMKIYLREDLKIILILFFFGFWKYIVKVKLYRYISQKWYNSIYVLHMTSDFGTLIHVNVNLCYTFLFIFLRAFIIVIYAFYHVCIFSTYINIINNM